MQMADGRVRVPLCAGPVKGRHWIRSKVEEVEWLDTSINTFLENKRSRQHKMERKKERRRTREEMRRLNLNGGSGWSSDVNGEIGRKCLVPASTQLLPIKSQTVYFILVCYN